MSERTPQTHLKVLSSETANTKNEGQIKLNTKLHSDPQFWRSCRKRWTIHTKSLQRGDFRTSA